MYYCKESGPIPSHPVQLDEGFTSWLEKLSTNLEEQSEKAVIVIDGVDLITVSLWCMEYHEHRQSLSLSFSFFLSLSLPPFLC